MPFIDRLTVEGLRGFRHGQSLKFAQPTGEHGSGLTILVGANNSGKSTVVEAMKALGKQDPTSYSVGKRNAYDNERIRIQAEFVDRRRNRLETVEDGGSQTRWHREVESSELDIAIIQSRRGFNPFFGMSAGYDRRTYNQNNFDHSGYRPQVLNDQFASRLFRILGDTAGAKAPFDQMLGEVLGYVPKWTIDQTDNGQYFVKFELATASHYHSSEGVGEGIVSLFALIDQLYDSDDQSVIVIDEPELSLHPQLQRRLRALISKLSADRQIAYTTHSPFFVDWSDIRAGAEVARSYKDEDNNCILSQASRSAIAEIISLMNNVYNPHTLGLNASEVFFIEDNVIITEGQEDVIIFDKISEQIGQTLHGSFYGWGAGGAGNISKVCGLLESLGYTKVVAIFDGDKKSEAEMCRSKYPKYHIEVLPADDIRYKPAQSEIPEKSGLWMKGGLDVSKVDDTKALYKNINNYLDEASLPAIICPLMWLLAIRANGDGPTCAASGSG